MKKTFYLLVILLGWSVAGYALNVKIGYPLIQKEVERQLFTNGKSYLSGDPSSTCEYAYVQNPVVFPDHQRLAIQANFNGKTGKEVLGKCIGVGKSFDIVVSGKPVYREGLLRLDDVQLQFKNSVADAVFGKLLEGFAESIEQDLTFPIQADAQQASQFVNQGGYQLKVET